MQRNIPQSVETQKKDLRVVRKNLASVIRAADLPISGLEVKNEEKAAVSTDKMDFILNKFNKGKKSTVISESYIRGTRIKRDEFLLLHRNNNAELVAPSDYNLALPFFNLTDVIEILGYPKINAPFYGAHGKYVVNVPIGSYFKAWANNQALLLGEGTHVIHDASFQLDGNYSIDQKMAQIQHGNINIIRVPAGQLAKIWIGQTPYLLDHSEEPYVFTDPLFRAETHMLVSATEKLIVHGSIKRLLPHTGEVALTYDGGVLKVVEPSENGQPILIDSPTHLVEAEFLDTRVQTLVFPSERTKEERKKENRQASTDEINYEVLSTSDSLKIGVKLLVIYQIVDPKKAVTQLGVDGIVPHVENLATVDMGMAMRRCTSQDFLIFSQTKPQSLEEKDEQKEALNSTAPSAPSGYQHFQDEVKAQLAKDLKEFGIELIRLNFEMPKVLNQEIAKKMEEQSLLTAEANAKSATLVQNTRIAQARAEQEAAVASIQQTQQNSNKQRVADTEAEVAKLQARTNIEVAEAKAKALAIETKAKAEAIKQEALAKQEAQRNMGEIYKNNPILAEIEIARIQADALRSATIYITPQEWSKVMPGLTQFGLLASFAAQAKTLEPQAEHKPQIEGVKRLEQH